MKKIKILVLMACLPLIFSCGHSKQERKQDTRGPIPTVLKGKQAASVNIKPKSGSRVNGMLRVSQLTEGIKISGEISGLAPNSAHGFHIHEKSDCSASDASSAGGHFSPKDNKHGERDSQQHHAGDLGNIRADEAGTVKIEMLIRDLKIYPLNDTRSVLGKSIIVHKHMDDLTSQPSGNAGARIGCGTIQF